MADLFEMVLVKADTRIAGEALFLGRELYRNGSMFWGANIDPPPPPIFFVWCRWVSSARWDLKSGRYHIGQTLPAFYSRAGMVGPYWSNPDGLLFEGGMVTIVSYDWLFPSVVES